LKLLLQWDLSWIKLESKAIFRDPRFREGSVNIRKFEKCYKLVNIDINDFFNRKQNNFFKKLNEFIGIFEHTMSINVKIFPAKTIQTNSVRKSVLISHWKCYGFCPEIRMKSVMKSLWNLCEFRLIFNWNPSESRLRNRHGILTYKQKSVQIQRGSRHKLMASRLPSPKYGFHLEKRLDLEMTLKVKV